VGAFIIVICDRTWSVLITSACLAALATAFSRKWHREILVRIEAQTEHLQAVSALSAALDGAPVYWSRYAFAPESLCLILYIVQSLRIRTVLELGSGISTLAIAKQLKARGLGRIDSFDHNQRWCEISLQTLADHGLETASQVGTAPLTTVQVAGEAFQWYQLPKFVDGASYDLILVDGPPSSSTNPLARLPALYELHHLMSEKSVLIMDDADREWETAVGNRWQQDFPDMHFRKVRIGRGLLVGSTSKDVFELLP
jgi:predicted O-methyltransferase YrrM